ncbi:aspartate aminotransferase family protein [Nostoc commune]|uniref:aspartate aminotransferase family protein n=1 Tax=Nostoc commune TaxID=1178 RepID=UPI001E5942F3|nr:aminotransferase class III-fold pyridoxal phosphate-dependent enzyme [Nostoc commune]MBG1261432.1 aminotransferase class III-fold pyridoxal phosphate-dependent enzyme [Nostoc commune BAE]
MSITTSNIKDSIYYEVNDTVFEKGQGVYVYDSKGNQYLDCAAGTFNLSLGYSNREVLESIKKQADNLIHATSSSQNEPVTSLVRQLVNLSPDNLTRVHPKVCSGSTANEGAIKIAQHFTGKRDVITLFRSHLGQSMMTTSLSGNAFRKKPFPNLFPGAVHVPDPYCHRCFYNQKKEDCALLCVEKINDFIEYSSSGSVACMIVEPISGNGGNIISPPGYLDALKKLCDEQGIVLIFDEIQTGIGRTGKMFAADYFGVQPNMITLGKGLGGTGFQIAAILTEEKMVGLEGHHHSFTNGANVLAATAAVKTLEIISQPEFLKNVEIVGNYIMSRLYKMQENYACIDDVRGVGLMIGVEISDQEGNPDAKKTNQIAECAKKHGLLIRTSRYGYGNVFKLRPPLIMTLAEAEWMCDQLEKVLLEVAVA